VEEWSRAVGQSIGISLSITRTTHWPVEKSKIDVEVGARIRVTRKLLGLSQTALAERLGFTFQQVQNTKRAAIASDLAAFKS
jgi:ribosome-binding protein aMBF1 (putative translation factor)